MDIQALEKLIKERRSIRQWKKKEVPDNLLKKAVELATWAPNGGNFQVWRFVVVKQKEVIRKMGDAVQSIADKVGFMAGSEVMGGGYQTVSKKRFLF